MLVRVPSNFMIHADTDMHCVLGHAHWLMALQMKNVPMGVGGRGRAVAARAKAKAGAAPGRGRG